MPATSNPDFNLFVSGNGKVKFDPKHLPDYVRSSTLAKKALDGLNEFTQVTELKIFFKFIGHGSCGSKSTACMVTVKPGAYGLTSGIEPPDELPARIVRQPAFPDKNQ